MKLSFSTQNVAAESFLALCDKTAEYGFQGFEIFDAYQEKQTHEDSIFNSFITPGAKRKLVNRHIQICALTFPQDICADTDPAQLEDYVEQAALSGVSDVVIRMAEIPENVLDILNPAVRKAQALNVMVLLETAGALANTPKVLEIIAKVGSAAMGVCWNIRQTYFLGR